MKTNPTTESAAFLYFKASITVAFRGLLSLPFEHPFDSLKTKMQARGKEISMLSVTTIRFIKELIFNQLSRDIYRNMGFFRGFYEGFVPNALRVSLKNLYRWPMVISFPNFFRLAIPKRLKDRYPSADKILTGLTIAGIESFIICPLERVKVFLMTKERNMTLILFLQENRGKLTQSLFQGIKPQLYRQIVSWTSFLYFDFKAKQIARKAKNLQPTEHLDELSLVLISLAVGAGNTIVIMPVDMIKTQYQKHGNNEFANISFLGAAKKIYREQGVKSFYFGWKPRSIQYVIQAQFMVPILDRVEVCLRKHSQKH